MLVYIDIDGDFSNWHTGPVKVDIVGSLTGSYSFKDNDLLFVAWLALEWHVVIKTGEQNVVV